MKKGIRNMFTLALALCMMAAALSTAFASEDAKVVRTIDGDDAEATVTVTVTPDDFTPVHADEQVPEQYTALQAGDYVIYAYNMQADNGIKTVYRAYAEYNRITGWFPVTITLEEDGSEVPKLCITLEEDDTVLVETDLANNPTAPEITTASDNTKLATVYTEDGEEIKLPLVQAATQRRSINTSGMIAGSAPRTTPAATPTPDATPAPTHRPAATNTPASTDVITTNTVEVTRVVRYGTEYVIDPDVYTDAPERVAREGVDGEKIVTYTVTYVNGVETRRVKTSERVSIAPINRIVVKGGRTHDSTTRRITETETIPYETIFRDNANRFVDEGPVTVQAGSVGRREIVYSVTYVDGVETARTEVSNRITVRPVNEIIERGTKTHSSDTQVIYEQEMIPFTTEYVNDNAMYVDDPVRVTQTGTNGVRQITYTVIYRDGMETSRTKTGEEIIRQPVNEIVHKGTKQHVTSTETVYTQESIPFKTVYEDDNTIYTDAPQRVTQEGVDGVRRIAYTVTYRDGVEVSRTRSGEEIVRAATDRIIRRGTRQHTVTYREETVVNVIPFETRTDEHPEWWEGDTQVIKEGVNGEETIVYRYTIRDGVETGEREIVSQTVTRQPVTKVVGVGTRTGTYWTYTYEVVGTSSKGPRGSELVSRARSHAMAMAKAEKVYHAGSGFVESVGSFSNPGSAFSGLVAHVPGINTAGSYGYACVCRIATTPDGIENRNYYAAIFAYGEQEDESLIQDLGGDDDEDATPAGPANNEDNEQNNGTENTNDAGTTNNQQENTPAVTDEPNNNESTAQTEPPQDVNPDN